MQDNVVIRIVHNVPVHSTANNEHDSVFFRAVHKAMRKRHTRLPAGCFARVQYGFFVLDQYQLAGDHIEELVFRLVPVPMG